MTLAMCCEIKFLKTDHHSEFSIYRVSKASIETSWKLICGKAEIILPRNIKDFDKYKIKEIFKRGDKVEIYLGYNGNLNHRFTGYIDQVSADIPVTIKLEDEMWKLKQIEVSFAHPNIKLKEFVTKIIGSFPIDIDSDIALGAVRFNKMKFGEILNKLRDEYSLYAFIRNGKFTIYKVHSDVTENIPVFDLERNCSDNSLNYISKDDRLVKIIGTTIQRVAKAIKNNEDQKKLKFEWGDKDAKETINWTFNVTTLEDLQREVKKMYNDRKRDGFDGKFTTLGLIPLQHGQKVKLQSSLYPDRNGIYYIDGISETFSKEDGYKQEVELGQTASK